MHATVGATPAALAFRGARAVSGGRGRGERSKTPESAQKRERRDVRGGSRSALQKTLKPPIAVGSCRSWGSVTTEGGHRVRASERGDTVALRTRFGRLESGMGGREVEVAGRCVSEPGGKVFRPVESGLPGV